MDKIHTNDIRAGVRIEIITIAWMVIEMAVSIGAGIAARSVLLVAFGLDSLIELVSGGMLLWRLNVESRGGDVERVEQAEKRAERVVAVTLALLSVYVLVSAVYGLIAHTTPENSPLGIAVAAGAVLAMPYLAMVKRRIAGRIHSQALAGDAVNSITCAYMAGTVLLGLALFALFGWWWVDKAAALVFLYWLGRETLEMWEEVHSS
jgi:divalent metal cation (Fe/Co/Zn/Cd) transporter